MTIILTNFFTMLVIWVREFSLFYFYENHLQ
jgi:hypothetical protein